LGKGRGHKKMRALSETVTVTFDAEDIPSDEVLQNELHLLYADVDLNNRDIYLNFSSHQALYDFARSLLQEAVFGESGQKDFYPLLVDGKKLVVEGTRLAENSSRIFVTYETLG
jgi:hypothetical protein